MVTIRIADNPEIFEAGRRTLEEAREIIRRRYQLTDEDVRAARESLEAEIVALRGPSIREGYLEGDPIELLVLLLGAFIRRGIEKGNREGGAPWLTR